MIDLLKNSFCSIENVQAGTPANAIVRFFYGWKIRNLDLMLENCQITWKEKPRPKEKLELFFGDLFIVGMKITNIKMINPCMYDIVMQVGFKKRNQYKVIITIVTGQVICESKPRELDINGKWGLNPLTILKAFGIYKRIFVNPENII